MAFPVDPTYPGDPVDPGDHTPGAPDDPRGPGGPGGHCGDGGDGGDGGDDLVPPTFFEPPDGAGGMPAPDPRGNPIGLPPSLAGRFQPRERLPRRTEQTVHRAAEEGRPAELRAAVFRVSGQDDATERIVKWYHPDAAPDPAVTRRLLRGPLHQGLSYVLEAGRDRGAPYHVLPSHGSTDLATHLRDRGPLPADEIRGIVERLHGALTALHGAGIVHRDVKPSNLVLGDCTHLARGLVLIDFGISVADFPRQMTGGWAGTPGYVSPEAQVRVPIVRPADDWWSLGIVVAEAALGRHPVPHHQPGSVMEAVQRGDIDLDGIRNRELRLLCEGLLTVRHENRWGAEQVGRWLAGESPEVIREGPRPGTGERTAAAPELPRFEHAGKAFTDPARLGEVFDADWPAMTRRLARTRDREELAEWLAPFRPLRDRARADALDPLLERLRRPRRRPAAATLIDLISWMAPHLEPRYRDIPLGMGDLVRFARRAADGDRHCLTVLDELRRHDLLTRLSRRRGGEELVHVARRWESYHGQWATATARLSQIPELGRYPDDLRAATTAGPVLSAELLQLAADPAEVTRRLRTELQDFRRTLIARVPWFTRLAEDTEDPVRLLLTLRLRQLAEADAQEIRTRQERDRQIAATDARSRNALRVRRWLELPVMLGWAATGALLVFFPHAFVVAVADVYALAPQSTVLVAWVLSVPSLAALLLIECWTAWYVGYLYHPQYSLVRQLSRRALPVTSRITVRGWRQWLRALLAAAAVVGTVVGTFVLAVWIWPAATVLAVLVSAVLRARSWRRYQAEARSHAPLAPQPPAGPQADPPAGPRADPPADPRGGVPGARRPPGTPSPSLSPSGSRPGGVA